MKAEAEVKVKVEVSTSERYTLANGWSLTFYKDGEECRNIALSSRKDKATIILSQSLNDVTKFFEEALEVMLHVLLRERQLKRASGACPAGIGQSETTISSTQGEKNADPF
jgi:hypothetical protein